MSSAEFAQMFKEELRKLGYSEPFKSVPTVKLDEASLHAARRILERDEEKVDNE